MNELRRGVYILLFLVLFIGGLYYARGFLIPLTLASVLALLFTGISNFLEKRKVGRAVSSLVSVLLFVLVVALIITALSVQLNSFMDNMGEMKEKVIDMLRTAAHWLQEKLGISYDDQKEILKEKSRSSELPSSLMSMAVDAILVIVYMFLILFYRTHIKRFILKIVPKKAKRNAINIVHESVLVIQKYLGGLGAMVVMLWIMYSIGFSIVGVDNALFFAILCGTLEIIPFVGNLAGSSITALAVLVQGGGSSMLIGVLATYLTIQFIQTYILEPLVVGEQVSINPLFTIVGIVLGEMLWGAAGMFLAIPLLGIAKIICDHVPDLKPYGFLIGSRTKKKKKFPEKIKSAFSKGK